MVWQKNLSPFIFMPTLHSGIREMGITFRYYHNNLLRANGICWSLFQRGLYLSLSLHSLRIGGWREEKVIKRKV